MVTKYMADSKERNRGDAAAHDFTTVKTLIKFPFTRNFAPEFWQVGTQREESPLRWVSNRSIGCLLQIKKVAASWKALYKESSITPTIKPNELVSFTVAAIQEGVQTDDRCAGLAVTCLDGILTTMNYKDVLGKGEEES